MTPGNIVMATWGSAPGAVPRGTEEVLALARDAAAGADLGVDWLILGAVPDQALELAERYGVAHVDRIEDPKLQTFQPDLYVEALAQYCARRSPKALLFSQTFDVRVVAPRLAARLGSAVVMNTLGLEADSAGRLQITASAYGGDTNAVYEFAGGQPCIVAVLPNAVRPRPPGPRVSSPALRELAVDLRGVEERIRVVEHARSEGPRLEDAAVIVAGGRGLGAPENYKLVEELAQALGGMAAASRPIVDEGWAPCSRQVGLTGKITRPALYIAAGISGASQHMAGCAAAKTIVAINRDPEAAIFRYARYGVVADCVVFLPELLRAVERGGQVEER